VPCLELFVSASFFALSVILLTRFLYNYNSMVAQTVGYRLSTHTNYEALLNGLVGSGLGPDNAVYELISRFEYDQITFVSEYAAKKLASVVTVNVIDKCRYILSDDVTWQNWVTKLELLHMLHRSDIIPMWDVNGVEIHWKGRSVHEFDESCDDESIEKDVKANAMKGFNWGLPRRWNEGPFDALSLPTHTKLRCVHITDAITHSTCKLGYLIPYVRAFGVYEVEFVYVCRAHNFAGFRIPMGCERENLDDLLGALQEIRDQKFGAKVVVAAFAAAVFPNTAGITFSKVIYQSRSDKPVVPDTPFAGSAVGHGGTAAPLQEQETSVLAQAFTPTPVVVPRGVLDRLPPVYVCGLPLEFLNLHRGMLPAAIVVGLPPLFLTVAPVSAVVAAGALGLSVVAGARGRGGEGGGTGRRRRGENCETVTAHQHRCKRRGRM